MSVALRELVVCVCVREREREREERERPPPLSETMDQYGAFPSWSKVM